MVFKNELYSIHFYGRVRGKCDGRLQNWPGIANERPKFLAMRSVRSEIRKQFKQLQIKQDLQSSSCKSIAGFANKPLQIDCCIAHM